MKVCGLTAAPLTWPRMSQQPMRPRSGSHCPQAPARTRLLPGSLRLPAQLLLVPPGRSCPSGVALLLLWAAPGPPGGTWRGQLTGMWVC
jgi:hypothetical protein